MKPSTSKLITILAALAGSAVVVMCSPAHADAAGQPGATAEELRELRKQKEALCIKSPECAGELEAGKQARRGKAAEKLRAEIAALSR